MDDKRGKWEQELGQTIVPNEFASLFQDIYKVTNVPKYRSFQYRLLNRAIVNNVLLHRWKILESDCCTFCQKNAETYTHLFVMCEKTQIIWVHLERYMYIFTDEDIEFNISNVLLNRISSNPRSIKNFLCLVCKQYIYRQRCFKTEPNFNELKEIITRTHNIEKFIATKNDKLIKFHKKWYNKVPEDLLGQELYETEYIVSNL